MLKLLLPVDGSTTALHAVEYVIRLAGTGSKLTLYLVNVQAPADSWELKSFMKAAEIEAMQESKGGDALASARARLDAAGIAYTPEVLLGEVATSIVEFAGANACDVIVMGNQGESLLSEVVTGSVAHDVLRLSAIPVTLVK